MNKSLVKNILVMCTSAILLAGIVAGSVYLWKITNGFEKEPIGFYVKSGDDLFLYDQNISLKYKEKYKFQIISTYNHDEKYNVSIKLNKDFSFTVNEQSYTFSKLDYDYKDLFDLEFNSNEFSIVLNYTIIDILHIKFSDEDFNDINVNDYYFRLEIEFNNQLLTLPFNLILPPESIYIGNSEVVF